MGTLTEAPIERNTISDIYPACKMPTPKHLQSQEVSHSNSENAFEVDCCGYTISGNAKLLKRLVLPNMLKPRLQISGARQASHDQQHAFWIGIVSLTRER